MKSKGVVFINMTVLCRRLTFYAVFIVLHRHPHSENCNHCIDNSRMELVRRWWALVRNFYKHLLYMCEGLGRG